MDVFKEAIKAKICVLPTYYDVIPGTIIESMFMKIPVVAYAVGGIPTLNDNVETVRLVDKYDINGLAKEPKSIGSAESGGISMYVLP